MAIPPAPYNFGIENVSGNKVDLSFITDGFLPAGFSEFLSDSVPVQSKPAPTAGSGIQVYGIVNLSNDTLSVLTARNRNSEGETYASNGPATKYALGVITRLPALSYSDVLRISTTTYRIRRPGTLPDGMRIRVDFSYYNGSLWSPSVDYYISSASSYVDATVPSGVRGIWIQAWYVNDPATAGSILRAGPVLNLGQRSWSATPKQVNTATSPQVGFYSAVGDDLRVSWSVSPEDFSVTTEAVVNLWTNPGSPSLVDSWDADPDEPFFDIPGADLSGAVSQAFVTVTLKGTTGAPSEYASQSGSGNIVFRPQAQVYLPDPYPENTLKISVRRDTGTSQSGTMGGFTLLLKDDATTVASFSHALTPPYPDVDTYYLWDTGVFLEDDTEYDLTVTYWDPLSLISSEPNVQGFTTDFSLPAPLIIDSAEEDPITKALTLSGSWGSGATPFVSFTWATSSDGGQTWSDESASQVSTVISDLLRPLTPEVMYRFTILGESGGINVSYYTWEGDPILEGMWNSGVNQEHVLKLRLGLGDPPRADPTEELHKTLHYFAGRDKPVEISTDRTAVTIPVKFLVLTVAEKNQALFQATLPGPHLLRMPDGIVYWCSIGPVSTSRVDDHSYEITFTATEIER